MITARMEHPYDEDPKYSYVVGSEDNEPNNPYYEGYSDDFILEEI